jgi:homoserine acetyltransferase
VVQLSIEGDASAEDIEAALVRDLKAEDVVAAYAPDHIELLSMETIRPAADRSVRARVERLEAAGAEVEFHAFPSEAGHDSFLVDLARFEGAIRGFLARR